MKEINYSLLMDLYELTMANGYYLENKQDDIVYFDMFFRRTPDRGSFAIAAGLEQLIDYIENIRFNKKDIEYLESLNLFDKGFLEYLENFKFTGDIWAVEEGTPVFPQEPLIIVRAPIIEAQIIETMLLLSVNHQTLIATKANRMYRASKGIPVIEFGARRAQGKDGAYLGARASYIGGVKGTSNVLAGKKYNIPVYGTMAHSWVQIFDDEYEAFKTYAEAYPDNTVLLVDTYNTLNSGVPNAIKVFDEVLKPLGKRPMGIRLDSGDLTFLSIEARKMLDNAGYEDVKIMASNSLDENVVIDLRDQGAKIDIYGIGERLITSKSDSAFGGVYKLVATEKDGEIVGKIKISESVEKITTPFFKSLYRLYDKKTNKAIADLITLRDEVIDEKEPYELFCPIHTWKKTVIKDFIYKDLLVRIYDKGKLVYKKKSIEEIIRYRIEEEQKLWDGVKRLKKPHKYFVDLSLKLWNKKNELLNKYSIRGRK